jgi:hypothetical protein
MDTKVGLDGCENLTPTGIRSPDRQARGVATPTELSGPTKTRIDLKFKFQLVPYGKPSRY